MRILLVEDDHFKQEKVEETIRRADGRAQITLARSVQQAVKLLRSAPFDRIVLDMALPSHESRPGGAQPISQPSGGIELLLELAYDARSEPVIIVTQYPEIEYDGRFYPLPRAGKALSGQTGARVVEVIYFNPQDSAWSDQLEKALNAKG